MKSAKYVVLGLALTCALLPVESFAKSRKHRSGGVGLQHRSEDFLKAVAICRKKYGGSYDVSAEWGSHFGQTSWWCIYT